MGPDTKRGIKILNAAEHEETVFSVRRESSSVATLENLLAAKIGCSLKEMLGKTWEGREERSDRERKPRKTRWKLERGIARREGRARSRVITSAMKSGETGNTRESYRRR